MVAFTRCAYDSSMWEVGTMNLIDFRTELIEFNVPLITGLTSKYVFIQLGENVGTPPGTDARC